MVHPSPHITTVNRSAERRAKLEDARWPAARRHILRFSMRAVSLSAALSVMLYTFPPLLEAAHAHPVVPASFLTAEERMAQRQAEREQAERERAERKQAEKERAAREQTDRERTAREQAAQDGAEPEQTEPSADGQENSFPSAAPETDSPPESAPIPELVILPPPSPSGETENAPGETENVPKETEPPAANAESVPQETPPGAGEDVSDSPYLRPHATAHTFQLTDVIEDSAIKSQFAVLIDARTGEIIAERSSDALINPASMTKVLTLLTAVECLTGPDGSWDLDSYTWSTKEISEYCWVNDCSMAWFTVGEWVPVRDTLYGMILPSGADGALMLANYAAGSQEALVEKMNEKAGEIGLSQEAHFENCVGLYGENHVCTVRDMAVIMKAAMDHPVCRTVLGKEVWTTSQTEEHPNGILLVNRFLRRIKNEDSGLKIIGAKTGYVRQAGNCAVSMGRRADGREYICVTAKGPGSNQVIRDHAALYRLFCGGA